MSSAKDGARLRRSTKPSAVRMARLMDRRRRGFRCLTIEYCAADTDALIRRGYLDWFKRHDIGAIKRAIYDMLESL